MSDFIRNLTTYPHRHSIEDILNSNTQELTQALNAINQTLRATEQSLRAIASSLASIEQSPQFQQSSFPFLPVGFLLLVSAAGAYYYREKIKQAWETHLSTKPLAQNVDTQTQTEEAQLPVNTISTETIKVSDTVQVDASSQNKNTPETTPVIGSEQADNTTPTQAIPSAAAQAGVFSIRSSRSSSPVNVPSRNSPESASIVTPPLAAPKEGGILTRWFF